MARLADGTAPGRIARGKTKPMDHCCKPERLDHFGEGADSRPRLSLVSRGSPLASPTRQIATVDGVDLSRARFGGDFDAALAAAGDSGPASTWQ